MSFDIVRGIIRNAAGTQTLIDTLKIINEQSSIDGTLFLGYPLNATKESTITVDALLISKNKGLVAFIFSNPQTDPREEQDLLYYQLKNTLTNYEALRKKRDLAFSPTVITFYPTEELPQHDEDYIFCNAKNLKEELDKLLPLEETIYVSLCESLQKISSMKPRKKRTGLLKENSLGSIIKKIELEIANLDEWQKKAAFEIPEGPQRIRGLAGSGKTVVLALKAAYLHSQHPDWNIAVTFYTRSLSQQYKDMITNFSYEFMGDIPNWDKLQILHAWGTTSEPGIYSEIAKRKNTIPKTFSNAKSQYGIKYAFDGLCNELLHYSDDEFKPFYDAILIDEAQDMPASFFRLCYEATKSPKRIVFAYDELQNLNANNMPTIDEMFGVDSEGNPLVKLQNQQNESRQDIVLPICYRNTPWALTLAHALGFGIYRKGGLVQLFNDLDLWDDIGYKVISGTLDYGKKVQISRKEDSYPKYFINLLTPESAVQVVSFNNPLDQYQWVVNEIARNISEDELDPDDILVIFPEAYYAKNQYMTFRQFLLQKNINSILAGVNADRDTFKVENCITCSSIYRAKGNEAPMVYIVNAEYCAQGAEMITLRNTLFTAITRSRAWVRICGISPEMDIIKEEAQKCINNNYTLKFRVPTLDELEKMRLIHRDRTEEEKKKIKEASKALKSIIELIEKGELDSTVLPELNTLVNKINIEKNEDDADE